LHYFIGTSGWHYDHWRRLFYPDKLAKAKWLDFYARNFNTVELNSSFYRLPSEQAFTTWHDSTPPRFTFAVKVSRLITHIKRLNDSQEPLDTFVERAKILEEKLGPLLYQLPPSMHRDDARLESFLSILPQGLRHVFEFRHQSWLDDKVFAIMRRYNVGLCVFDMPRFSCPLVATADFVYLRFHGSTRLYSSSYSDDELAEWARGIASLPSAVKSAYAYFNNDVEACAVRNAITLRGYLEKRS
jgi:uncharacterized protein YecE (DUF72 family)